MVLYRSGPFTVQRLSSETDSKRRCSVEQNKIQESCAVAKMTARCTLYMGALNFRDSLTTPSATNPNIFSWSFVPIDPMNVPTKLEVRTFNRF